MIEEAVKLRSHANHDEVAMKQLEETITILLEHFKNEVNIEILLINWRFA